MKRTIDLSGTGLSEIKYAEDDISQECTSLLLDGNSISTISHLNGYEHLQKLSLAHNSITVLNGIAAGRQLRVVDLQNNNVISIEGLESVLHLEWLSLSGNSLRNVDGITNNVLLRHLDVSDNCISLLPDIGHLRNLKSLLLHGNLLRNMASLSEQLPSSISLLTLADNHFNDLTELLAFSSFSELKQISVMNNPCTVNMGASVDYRPFVLYCIKQVTNIDGISVMDQERESLLRRRTLSDVKMGDQEQLINMLLCCQDDEKFFHCHGLNTDGDISKSTESSKSLLDSVSTLLPLESFTSVEDLHVDDSLRSLSWTDLLSREQELRMQINTCQVAEHSQMEKHNVESADSIAHEEEKDTTCLTTPLSLSPTLDKGIAANVMKEEALHSLTAIHVNPPEINKPENQVELTLDEANRIMDLAACVIQACVKGWLQRKHYMYTMKRQKAATRIQAVWRGYHERRMVACRGKARQKGYGGSALKRIEMLEANLHKLSCNKMKENKLMVTALTVLWNEIRDVKREMSDLAKTKSSLDAMKEEFTAMCSLIGKEMHSTAIAEPQNESSLDGASDISPSSLRTELPSDSTTQMVSVSIGNIMSLSASSQESGVADTSASSQTIHSLAGRVSKEIIRDALLHTRAVMASRTSMHASAESCGIDVPSLQALPSCLSDMPKLLPPLTPVTVRLQPQADADGMDER